MNSITVSLRPALALMLGSIVLALPGCMPREDLDEIKGKLLSIELRIENGEPGSLSVGDTVLIECVRTHAPPRGQDGEPTVRVSSYDLVLHSDPPRAIDERRVATGFEVTLLEPGTISIWCDRYEVISDRLTLIVAE